MKSNISKRKRFYKPWHLFKRGKRPLRGLWEVFSNYHLDGLKEELDCWEKLALCNDQSAYDEGATREDLVDFVQQLQRLIEAFHILNEQKNADRKRKQLKGMPKDALTMIAEMNNPLLLTYDEKKNPEAVISQFCKTFRWSYAQMELLDLLEAVISYEGHKQIYKGQLVLFYEHLFYLVRLAYHICKRKRYLQNTKLNHNAL